MKKALLTVSIITLSISSYASDNDTLGLPGDNLDLAGALELFKKSATVEEFEKAINEEANGVNNLDLDNDGKVDYIRVEDHFQDSAHALILRVPVTETGSQDVAVIETEKSGSSVAVQAVGDEDLYGKNYAVEPIQEGSSKVVVHVNAWPIFKHLYAPAYVGWRSPWAWRKHPNWFKPWIVVPVHVHHKRVLKYRAHHHRVAVIHAPRAHKIYQPVRVRTVVMHKPHPRRHAAPHHGKRAYKAKKR